MRQQRWRVCVTGLLALSVFVFVGCARRPVSAMIAAPAPTGSETVSRTARVEATAPMTGSAPEPQGAQVEAPAPAVTEAPAPVTGSAPEPQAAQVEPTAPTPASPSERIESPLPEKSRRAETLKEIHFEFDKYKLRPEDTGILDHSAAWMRANPQYIILIEGHADDRGTTEYNLALGERRANAAKNYLLGQGVPANRVTIVTYGKERPLCPEHNEKCWGKNRRAHFMVTTQSAQSAETAR